MLVHHNVDAEIVAERPFVEIAMIKVSAEFRVVDAARDDVTERIPLKCQTFIELTSEPGRYGGKRFIHFFDLRVVARTGDHVQ